MQSASSGINSDFAIYGRILLWISIIIVVWHCMQQHSFQLLLIRWPLANEKIHKRIAADRRGRGRRNVGQSGTHPLYNRLHCTAGCAEWGIAVALWRKSLG